MSPLLAPKQFFCCSFIFVSSLGALTRVEAATCDPRCASCGRGVLHPFEHLERPKRSDKYIFAAAHAGLRSPRPIFFTNPCWLDSPKYKTPVCFTVCA